VQCPVEHIERGKVYERLVNNAADPWSVEDVRLSVIGNQIPVAYLKRRWKEQRFQNTNFQVTLASVDHVISPTEKALILKFSRAMKLDCGELDVLRDRDDNRLYIVDVNKTATGPGRLAFFPKIRAIALMAEAFRQEFLS
jgi:glutathione synthase/RimK-type ligase-like ATP-grasp enzyme